MVKQKTTATTSVNRTAVCVNLTPKLRTVLKHQSAIENRPVCQIIEPDDELFESPKAQVDKLTTIFLFP
jgi:hypothetical protein